MFETVFYFFILQQSVKISCDINSFDTTTTNVSIYVNAINDALAEIELQSNTFPEI